MNHKIYILLLTGFLFVSCAAPTLVPTPTPAPPPTSTPAAWDREGWNLVWQDEFEGSEIDRTKWTFDKGGNGWGNAEWQYYSDRPENARIENGLLIIEAREEDISFSGKPYSSARLKTQGLHSWKYGRIEARMKLPYGQGIWPAFWMLGDDNKGWPASGEIDILEHIGREPNAIYATVHAPGYSGGNGVGSNLAVPGDTLKDDFHVYAIEWQEDEIRWLFDEREYFKITPQDVPDAWIFDHEFYLLLNLAIGGRWPGYPDDSTVLPQFLTVDYVRVYQRP